MYEQDMTILLPLILFATSTTITPGPNNIMLATSGANFGYRRTLPHISGIMIGFPFMVVAVGLGLGRYLHAQPLIWDLLKIAGFIFLLFLAWKIATFQAGEEKKENRSYPLTFWQAAAFQWLNPKAWALVLVAIPTYTSGEENILGEVLIIGLVYFVVSFPAATLWTLFGMIFRKWLASDSTRRWFNWSMSVLLILSVVFTWILD